MHILNRAMNRVWVVCFRGLILSHYSILAPIYKQNDKYKLRNDMTNFNRIRLCPAGESCC